MSMSNRDRVENRNSVSGGAERPRSFKRGGLVVLVLVGALAVMVGLRIKAATGNARAVAQKRDEAARTAARVAIEPRRVMVVRGQPATVRPEIRLEGTLTPMREADLGFKVGGRIGAIKVKVGDRVRAGAVLATLDAHEVTAQLRAAEAQVAAAEAQAALAADAAQRTAVVVSSGAQPEAAGVQARQQKALADAQRQAAEAQLALARTAVANHTLTAPFAGTVSRVPPGPGAVVGPGLPQFHLADYATLKLVGTVAAEDARLVKVGAAVKVAEDARAGGGRKHEAQGKVVAVVAALDAATRRVPVEAEIANDREQPLLAGTLVRSTIAGANDVTVLRLPSGVLRPGTEDEVVVVKDGVLDVRRVAAGFDAGGGLEVRRGLDAADEVVARPWAEAKRGEKVTVSAAAGEASAKATAARPQTQTQPTRLGAQP
jgi:RND family efflux transporter MFP subunit